MNSVELRDSIFWTVRRISTMVILLLRGRTLDQYIIFLIDLMEIRSTRWREHLANGAMGVGGVGGGSPRKISNVKLAASVFLERFEF